MRTIICGMRTATKEQTLAAIEDALNPRQERKLNPITEVVSGGCKGPDTFGEDWATAQGIPVKRFPADWATHGRAAGPIRNSEMIEYADQVIAVWDGKSKGTGDTVRKARRAGLPVHVHLIKAI